MPEATPPPARLSSGWTAWGATWITMLIGSLAAVLVLAFLSAQSARTSLEEALSSHVMAQARLTAAGVDRFPVELLATLGGERTTGALRDQLQELATASGLHDIAVMGPEMTILRDPDAESWIAALAEQDLIERARGGETISGPLYRGADGEPYLTAYTPMGSHAGWVVAVEGSGASLGALDALRRLQLQAGIAVLVFTGLLGAALARWVVEPLRRLDGELSAITPGDPPEALSLQGPREVREVAAAARHLLATIRQRDRAIQEGHQRELDQLSRMAAEVAHEVRNPLNAISLSVGRLRKDLEPERRRKVADRIGGQIGQMEVIVQRLVDVAKPLQPLVTKIDLSVVLQAVAEEVSQQGGALKVDGPPLIPPLRSDPVMVTEILRNLCLNALQAGATSLSLALDLDGELITLTLEDDGPGIPEGDEAAIFDWFHTRRASGSGLGLPTSRRMATALGGSLRLRSPRPARFELTLPTSSPHPSGVTI